MRIGDCIYPFLLLNLSRWDFNPLPFDDGAGLKGEAHHAPSLAPQVVEKIKKDLPQQLG